MHSFQFLILGASLIQPGLALISAERCTCTKTSITGDRTLTRTYVGLTLCSDLKLKPTCTPRSALSATRTKTIRSTSTSTHTTTTTSTIKSSTYLITDTTTSTTESSTSLITVTTSTPEPATTLITVTKPTATVPDTSAACAPSTGKRGLAYNDPTLTNKFTTCGPDSKVSWAYNWFSTPYSWDYSATSGYNTDLKFVPMLWSDKSDFTKVWFDNVEKSVSSYGADAVLAFNEPDGCADGGSCMSVEASIDGYQKWISPLRSKYPGLKLGAPAVTNGGGSMGLNYLSRFLDGCKDCNIDFVPLHWYGDTRDVEGFKNYIYKANELLHSKYPLWITEFGSMTGTLEQKEAFLRAVLPWLDAQGFVERYAFFMDAKGQMIDSGTDALSRTGVAFNSE